MKPTQAIGIIGALSAGVLWLMGRWTHELLRCLGGVGSGGRLIEDCTKLVSAPAQAFSMWFPMMLLSALWGVFLVIKGHRWLGAATILASLGVFLLAGSSM